MPSGLRSQTPMNHTASKPNAARASHSAEGTQDKSRLFPCFCDSSESQTQVLISYKEGYRGQLDMPRSTALGSAKVALVRLSPHADIVASGNSDSPKRK